MSKKFKVKVRFLEPGRWADVPGEPIIEVKKGDTAEFTEVNAMLAVASGKAEFVTDDAEPPAVAPTPPVEDKAKAQRGRGHK